MAEVIDIACLDVKLPSAAGVSADPLPAVAGKGAWAEPPVRACAEAAARGERFLKVVVASATTSDELTDALAAVLGDLALPVVLQPVTPVPNGPEPPSAGQMLALQEAVKRALPDSEVRVIPQTHKLMGQR